MTAKKNKVLLRVIGHRLREDPELGAAQPACRDIERQLELLRHIEARIGAHRDASYAAEAAESADRELIPAGLRTRD